MYPEFMAKVQGKPYTLAAKISTVVTAPIPELPKGEIHTQRIRGNVYMLYGAGGNITVQVGNEGVFVVDTGLANMGDKVLAAIQKLSDKPIRFIVDTHFHPDHTGNNAKLRQAGVTIAGGDVARMDTDIREGAAIIAHQEVLNRMSKADGAQPAAPFNQWPTDTYFGKRKDMFFNDEAVQLIHVKNAHTDGDTMVFFRRSDVLAVSDIFNVNSYPVMDLAHGGGIQGIIDGLNQILDLAVPAAKEEGGTMIVPGTGRLCDAADVAYYQNMITIIRDRVEDMIKRGMTLDQVESRQAHRRLRSYAIGSTPLGRCGRPDHVCRKRCIELLNTQRRVTEIRQQVIELLGKRLTDVGRKPSVVLVGPLRKADSHRRLGFILAARDSNAAIASLAGRVWAVGPAHLEIRQSFSQMAIHHAFGREGDFAALHFRFEQIPNVYARRFADAPRDHNLKFGFDGNKFHGERPLPQSNCSTD